MKNTSISLRLPEKEKEHGYSVLVAPKKRGQEHRISPCSFEIKGARLLCFGTSILEVENIILNKNKRPIKILDALTPRSPIWIMSLSSKNSIS